MDEKNDINRTIHRYLERCWHEFHGRVATLGIPKCDHCGLQISRFDLRQYSHPDYYSDLNAVREAELKFIEERGWKAYYLAIVPQSKDTVNLAYEHVQHITAPASVRATAIAKAIEEK